MTFDEARACVIERVTAGRVLPPPEEVVLESASGRVLAENILADRDLPALARSVRDGFAVRAVDVPGKLAVIGEVRAGDCFEGTVRPGEAVEIMTGAPVPAGANAIIMVEHVTRGADGSITTDRAAEPGQFINPQGCEARAGEVLLTPGKRLGFADIALLAAVGKVPVAVCPKPRVALLATGDEIVPATEKPRDFQIRNSNVYSLAAQVARAGGIPVILPVAKDDSEDTMRRVEQGLASDLLLLSGGVSAGKYDIVERVLADLGAEFFFDRVLIQPGQPLVFGRVQDKFFFGLPGNPASTMVTFELFARAALELLGGEARAELPLMLAPLTRDFRHKTGLTRFLPATVCWTGGGPQLTPIGWSGSGDVPALTRANAFLVADADRPEWKAGEWMRVLLK
ncbi:MAG: molybdopterin molybdotransferase MoeA [Acidobacteriia bacterium]|nr:molybdopterin molybdotransferase MoeA [Terriglobia bacterium]